MMNFEKDFPKIKFVIGDENQEQSGFEVRRVSTHEDCAICQDQMITARKLPCGHIFH